jgi:hypothetical protein
MFSGILLEDGKGDGMGVQRELQVESRGQRLGRGFLKIPIL